MCGDTLEDTLEDAEEGLLAADGVRISLAGSSYVIEPRHNEDDVEGFGIYQIGEESAPGEGDGVRWLFSVDDPDLRVAESRLRDWTRGIRHVSVYLVQRCYGGPEEGGWYYDAGELVVTETHPTPADAEARAEELRESEEYSNADRRELSSVISTGRYDVRVEANPGEDWPRRVPRYC